MKREQLKEMGLEDEAIDGVMKIYGKDVESIKSSAAEKEARAAELEAQLSKASATIQGFDKLDIDGVKKAASEWQEKAEKAQSEAEERVNKVKLDYAIDSAINAAKAKNPKAVRALLNLEEVQLAKGQLIGLEEQLEAIKSTDDYLFETEGPKKRAVGDNQVDGGLTDAFTAGLRDGAGLKGE